MAMRILPLPARLFGPTRRAGSLVLLSNKAAQLSTYLGLRKLSQVPKTQTMSTVEVERKFVPAGKLLTTLHRNDKCTIGSLSFERLDDEIIRDTYYDLDDQLGQRGVWVRRRRSSTLACNASGPPHMALPPDYIAPTWDSDTLEAKIKIGGSYSNSQFQEIVGRAEIAKYLATTTPKLDVDDLRITMNLETYRQTWKMSDASPPTVFLNESAQRTINSTPSTLGENRAGDAHSSQDQQDVMVVAIDYVAKASERAEEPETTIQTGDGASVFRHTIGELEMTRSVAETDLVARQEIARAMDAQLETIMAANHSLFCLDEKPAGKISAYLAWLKERKGKSS